MAIETIKQLKWINGNMKISNKRYSESEMGKSFGKGSKASFNKKALI